MLKRLLSILLVIITVSPSGLTVSDEKQKDSIIYSSKTGFFAAVSDAIKTNDKKILKTNVTSSNQEIHQPLRLIGRSRCLLKNTDFLGLTKCFFGSDNRFFMEFTSQETLSTCMEELRKDSNIIYVQQDCWIEAESLSEGQEHMSWGNDALKIDDFVDYLTKTNNRNSSTVAIVDSGVADIDILNDRLIQGYDFVDNDIDTSNDLHPQSHGTFLASIVADCTQGTNIKIMPIRVLSSRTGSLINAVNGIIYAVDHGADVINFSIGGILSDCTALDDAITYAQNNEVAVVVSAGNEKIEIKNYCPAHNESAITVSAVDSNLSFAESFSNFGEKVDLTAPGVDIAGFNAKSEKSILSGTSMSAAFISACAALIRLSSPECSVKKIQMMIKESCMDLGEAGKDDYYGFGIPQMDLISEVSYEDFLKSGRLEVLKPPDNTVYFYQENKAFDSTGLCLQLCFDNGVSETITDMSSVYFSQVDTSSVGTKNILVKYRIYETTVDVQVKYTWWQWIIKIVLFGWIWY